MMICQVPSTARQIRQMIRACIAASRSALPDARSPSEAPATEKLGPFT